ncbi:MAG: hypothetical protein ACLGHQ_09510 [Acidimicrobiia bacterium]
MSATFPPSLALVAHQGGWDEILLVAGPIVVIVAVLAVAKRRVDASFEQSTDGADAPDPDPDQA